MSTRSIYQTNGKPLSQQAIYQQKLKQGVYNSPGAAIVGVNSNASDTAALLAASADLTVKPSYERVVAVEAHNAALAAKNGTTSTFSSATSASAAAAALGKQGGTGIPEYKGSSVYQKASSNSTYSLSTRTDPTERDYRSGLSTKSSATTLDIGKISSVANQNSSKSLNSRFNPDLDFRSGLQSNKAPPTEFLDESEEDLAAKGAIASLKYGGSTSTEASTSVRSKSFTANQVVNKTLLDAANKAAETRLSVLNSTQPLDFKQQAQLYANALTLAQKRSDERIANHKTGVIDLGGGLTILQTELDSMAALIVKPILSDIENKADLQREQDEISKKKHQERQAEHEQYKREEFKKKQQEKLDLESARRERVGLNDQRKGAEDEAYAVFQTERHAEVTAKDDELLALKTKHYDAKQALIAEKEAELAKIEAEETELINGRKDELKTMQDEKDEILKPTLEELEVETKKLNELTDARDGLSAEVKASETTNEEYKAKLKELEEKLAAAETEFDEYTTKLEEATAKHEETSKNLDELHESSKKELEEAEATQKDLDAKIAALEKEEKENTETKAAHKGEIVTLLDERVANEHKINSELPEHLRRDVDEKKLKDTSSLFSEEEKKEIPLIEPTKEEEAPKKPEVAKEAAVKPTAAAPKTAAASKDPKKGKTGFRQNLKKLFSTPEPRRTDATAASTTAKTFKKESGDAAPAKVEKSVGEAAAESEPTKTPTRRETTEDIETIGDESLKKNTPGGLFKEEL